MKKVLIRRLGLGEFEVFKRVRLAALYDAPEAFGTRYADALCRSATSWQEQADASAQGVQRATFMAYVDGQAVGMAALYRQPADPSTAEMLQVWVAPDYRSQGVADDLIAALLNWGHQQGVKTVLAAIKTDNARALRFYKRLGFSLNTLAYQPGEDLLSKDLDDCEPGA